MLKNFLESAAGAILILILGMVFFSALVIGVSVYIPEDKEIYLLFANILSGFSGALFAVIRIKGTSVDASGGKDVQVNVTQAKSGNGSGDDAAVVSDSPKKD